MPHEIVTEVVSQVAQSGADVVVEEVHRKFGWKGCLLLTLLVIALGVGLYFLLR